MPSRGFRRSVCRAVPAALVPAALAAVAAITGAASPVVRAAPAGEAVYGAHCAACHGAEREGGTGPDLTDVRSAYPTVEALTSYIRRQMPLGNPGALGEEERRAAAEYLFRLDGAGETEFRVAVDGIPVTFDVPPANEGGRLLVPARPLAEALGATVSWDAESGVVTVRGRGHVVRLRVGDPHAEVDGRRVRLDVSPRNRQGRVLAPVRALAEALGAGVRWDEATRTVHVSTSD
ncbi:stalk domain-containing protein [Caldinitratiruptor microaerophilus]|uniref:Cytochrome c domain-containing protein n=1 Tax=Caldinitratiruptor microaerophilus TaxID=671077 RepID=A0AA35CN93_9FIRM|nr:stalk domain-containing protein [Caldinitratiruptor microaerophilus]BDG60702.1 hypothetical protein caldi_17920 [Caldinitratiruptor microaerophilus]